MRKTSATASATSSGAIIQLVSPVRPPGWPKLGVNTSRHNCRYAESLLPVVQHHGFGKKVQTRFGGIVSGAAAKCVLGGETGNIDDEAAPRRAKRDRASREQ